MGNKFFFKIIAIITIITITSCAAGSFKTKEQFNPEDVVNACFARSIFMCGDLICEAQNEHLITLKLMWSAMNDCLSNPQDIDQRYFDKDFQERMKNE